MLFSGMVATAAGFGWAALLKGPALLLVPTEPMTVLHKGVGFARFFPVGWSSCRRLAWG